MRRRYFGCIVTRYRRTECPHCHRLTTAARCPGCKASLHRRELPAWYVSWTDANGKRHLRAAGKDRAAAEKVLLELQAEREVLLPGGRRRRGAARSAVVAADGHASATLQSLSPAIMGAWRARLAEGTLRKRPEALRRWMERLGTVPVAVIRPSDVQQAVNRMRSIEDLAASTIHLEVAVLSAAFHTMRRDLGLDIPNPCREITLPRIQLRKRPHVRSEDVEKLLQAAAPRARLGILMFAEGGLRPAEVFRLSLGECSFALNAFVLTQRKTYEVRTIAWTQRIKAALEAWRATLPEGAPPATPVLGLSEKVFRVEFDRARKAAGLGEFVPYTLRHGYANTMLEQGAPINVVRDLLGHSTIRTTDRYLRSMPQAAAQRATEAFEKARRAHGNMVDVSPVAPPQAPAAPRGEGDGATQASGPDAGGGEAPPQDWAP